MKIVVLGWYGTETIGDRAILAGLISLFSKTFSDVEISLGSLYPFFSERTLSEDYDFYKEMLCKDIKIEIFNSRNFWDLDRAIGAADLVVMGGGPLMDLSSLFMVEYAFKKAKKKGVKTALLGCGVGPLYLKKYKQAALEILKHSCLTILRDRKSKESMGEILGEFGQPVNAHQIFTSLDPAVECALTYRNNNQQNLENYIAVNLRSFPPQYRRQGGAEKSNKQLLSFVEVVSNEFKDREIRLVPMHYFHIGGDDRVFLNSIYFQIRNKNIKVQNSNLSLKETLRVYQNAYFNIGMRFHSVLLQTIVSGRNYVLDYTEPGKGKISGFLKDIDGEGFFSARYTSLQTDDIAEDFIKDIDRGFTLDQQALDQKLTVYKEGLRKLMR